MPVPLPDVARRDELVERVRAALLADDRVATVELFGSLADGRADELSDIDVLVHLHSGVVDRDVFGDLPSVLAPIGSCVSGWSFHALASGRYGASFLFDEYPLFWGVDVGVVSDAPSDPSDLLATYRWEQIYKVWLKGAKAAVRAEDRLDALTRLVERHVAIDDVATRGAWIARLRAQLDAIERRKVDKGDPYEHLHARCVALLESLTPYAPTLAPDEIERIRAWHERAYEWSRDRGQLTVDDYLGLELVVPPTVQPITPTSHLLGEAVVAEVRDGDRVLDMGTGCGVNAILAARSGGHVVAVDINPDALAAAGANAERNGVADRIDVRLSDVFAAVPERFDVIVFDPPFRWFAPRDLLEAATTDEGYRAMRAFFAGARSHLHHGGRLLVFFGTSGDLGHLLRLVAENGFTRTEVASRHGDRDGVPVSYFTYRLT